MIWVLDLKSFICNWQSYDWKYIDSDEYLPKKNKKITAEYHWTHSFDDYDPGLIVSVSCPSLSLVKTALDTVSLSLSLFHVSSMNKELLGYQGMNASFESSWKMIGCHNNNSTVHCTLSPLSLSHQIVEWWWWHSQLTWLEEWFETHHEVTVRCSTTMMRLLIASFW